jgi:hypothetical protein
MSEPQAPTEAAPAEPAFSNPGLAALFDDDGAPATPQAAVAEVPAKAAPAANVPVDPLAEELFGEDVLVTPEQAREAAKLLRDERKKLADLRRKAQNAHAELERREKKFERTKQETLSDKARVAAYERALSTNFQDLESGDPERFLTAVQRMSKSADPASYWKKVSMKLASGGTFTEAEKEQAKADPETQARIAQLEQHIASEREAKESAYIEHLKTQHLHFAQQSDAHPYVKLYATEQPENIRNVIAQIMIEEHQRTGKSIDVKAACGKVEASLRAQYELSQRVGGNTDHVKETAGLAPGAGRDPSGRPPKPESATRAPTTVPASLAATQGQALRALSPREQRAQQVQSLPPAFWNQFGI